MNSASHTPRKRFGQNFLTDETTIDRIVQAIGPAATDTLIEIGPGQGALTRLLWDRVAVLHALEIDRDLVDRLNVLFADRPSVRIHLGDALKMDFTELAGRETFRLVGNLPYNISTPLLFHLLKWHKQIQDMHFMLQREVVERMAAASGSKARGKLSIMIQFHCRITPLLNVPPEAFSPRPSVESAFVRLEPYAQPPYDLTSYANFQRVVKAAFNMRRKTLKNSLASLLDGEEIESCGIDAGRRAESLEIDEFVQLANQLT